MSQSCRKLVGTVIFGDEIKIVYRGRIYRGHNGIQTGVGDRAGG